jgi:protein SCO1/2
MMRALAALAAVAILASGCGDRPSPFKGVDITGSDVRSDLRLKDAEGRPRAMADFRGKAVVVLFGYTHCPDVCPTSLANLAKAVRQLGKDGDRVQVIFISVDPKRDTPELLREYTKAFNPAFIALTGDRAAIESVAKELKAYSAVKESDDPAKYEVEHSGQMFVFDGQGRARLILPPSMPSADIASDLKVLLDNA